ncbi:actin-like protein [Ordospora colligata]|uniref:Actin-like protein n=1 Tax=Ordospora colligata OC4 TaxID=1354746 RepID=A0A0B2UKR2_9MICR|nr:actin-like protein [Ordospora colligata OC4]KHN69958.1 actin-like protein [Ordospora colligata OC4]TBU16128.1 actin-like protein [Ordospora colligata]TBU19045.1 actin-like protein [Ordospora colligata]
MYVVGDVISSTVDIGSETYKIGYCGSKLPSVYGSSMLWRDEIVQPVKRSVIGDVASYLGILSGGIPRDTESLVVCENSMEEEGVKRKVLGYLMEKRLCSSVLFVKSGILDVFSYGRSSGVVVSFGGGSTQVCSVVEGLITCRRQIDVGGIDFTVEVRRAIESAGVDFEKESGKVWGAMPVERREFEKNEICRYVKEAVCEYGEKEMMEWRYELRDRKVVDFDAIRREICEKITQVCRIVIEVIEMNAGGVKSMLAGNIMVSGGLGMMKGIEAMMNCEFEKEKPKWKIRVTVDRNRFSTFCGGSIVGSMGSAKSLYIGIRDYDEYGEGIVDRKRSEWIVEAGE